MKNLLVINIRFFYKLILLIKYSVLSTRTITLNFVNFELGFLGLQTSGDRTVKN